MPETYVLAHIIDSSNIPEDFTKIDWPLHITLVGNFCVEHSLLDLTRGLDVYSKQQEPFGAVIGNEELFGPNNDVPVSLVDVDENILGLHRGLQQILANLGVTYETPAFVGDGYRPHSTIQTNGRLYKDQSLTLDNMTLIDMCVGDKTNIRKVIRTFWFGS